MLIRSALTLLVAAVGASAVSAPAQAHGLLAALPAYAQPGACYAHVRRPAVYAPPPGPRGAWRLTPPGPGQPGPTWCFVTEPGGPPVLLRAGVDGWIRVACPHRHVAVRPHRPRPRVHLRTHHVRCGCRPARPHPRPHPRPHWRPAPPPCCIAPPPAPCCLRPTSPPPPPVVVLRPYNPAEHYGEPGTKALYWPGKR